MGLDGTRRELLDLQARSVGCEIEPAVDDLVDPLGRSLQTAEGEEMDALQPRLRMLGPVLGGCLSLLTAVLGTPWMPRLDDALLFVEDINEPPYRVDRMLTHLRLSGTLSAVRAIVAGRSSLRGLSPHTCPPFATTERHIHT